MKEFLSIVQMKCTCNVNSSAYVLYGFYFSNEVHFEFCVMSLEALLKIQYIFS